MNVIVPGGMVTPMMNTMTVRARLPAVPLILPVSKAALIIMEGLSRNVAVVAYPSVLTALISAVGAWPAGVRDVLMTSLTTQHHRQWRLGEVDEYRSTGGGGKQDDYYSKERSAETDKQRAAKREL